MEDASGKIVYTIMDLGTAEFSRQIHQVNSIIRMISDTTLLSPEVFAREGVTAQSDCYMVGQLIYSVLVGGHPFAGLGFEEIRGNHTAGKLPPLRNYRSDISPEFTNWLETLTDPSIENRCKSAEEALKTMPDYTSSAAVAKPPMLIFPFENQPVGPTTSPPPLAPVSLTSPAILARPVVINSSKNSAFKVAAAVAIVIGLLVLALSWSSGSSDNTATNDTERRNPATMDKTTPPPLRDDL